jgi:uncharacterized integral membrane protein
MKKKYIVIVALLAAILSTLLIFAGATDVATRFLSWLASLPKDEKAFLRTAILFVPLILIFAGAAIQSAGMLLVPIEF